MGASRTLTVSRRYLNLPVENGAPKRLMRLSLGDRGDRTLREFAIELARGRPDFWVVTDVAAFAGQRLRLEVDAPPGEAPGLDLVSQDDVIRGGDDLYRERYRPQVHFSSRRGWLNDPNGLLYFRGQYHLFYQHNPYGWGWDNMHWGHAVSPDLVHWEEREAALYPDETGTMFSGSGVVDGANTSGLQAGAAPPLVLIYTAAGGKSALSRGQPFTQRLAFSTDGGGVWSKLDGNPVLGHLVHENRDPKVIWHAPSRRWVMALYLDGFDFGLYASPDLRAWTPLGSVTIPDCRECPDLFPLAVDGDPEDTRWVLSGANGRYLLGRFDGQSFVPESAAQPSYTGSSYAAQTWSDVPAADGRRIQIAFMRCPLPGMPFNQFLTVPVELTLRRTAGGAVRLHALPIRELDVLHRRAHTWRDVTLAEGDNPLAGISGDLFRIRAEVDPGGAAECGFTVRGVPVVYTAATRRLACGAFAVTLDAGETPLRLQLLVDRASIEIFAQDGRYALPVGVIPEDGDRSLSVFARGGTARLPSLEVFELHSIWPEG
jgi:fructan beta-fructosidase